MGRLAAGNIFIGAWSTAPAPRWQRYSELGVIHLSKPKPVSVSISVKPPASQVKWNPIRESGETIPDHGFAVETEKKMADSTQLHAQEFVFLEYQSLY